MTRLRLRIGPDPVLPGRAWLRLGRATLSVNARELAAVCLLGAAALALALAGLTSGSMTITPSQVLAALAGDPASPAVAHVVLHIRLPRILVGLCVGLALGAAGAAFQGVTRNPLGAPDVIGFTAGSATGALVLIVLLGRPDGPVALAAIAGAAVTGTGVLALARRRGSVAPRRLVLVGLGVGAMLSALNALILVRGDLDRAVLGNLWLAGTLDGRGWDALWPLLTGLVLALPVLLVHGRALGILSMGDGVAAGLGIRIEPVRAMSLGAGVVLAALATAAAGPVPFIALSAPHLARRMTGAATVPVLASALTGAALMLGADLCARALGGTVTLPVGQITGLAGGLWLIWLLSSGRAMDRGGHKS